MIALLTIITIIGQAISIARSPKLVSRLKYRIFRYVVDHGKYTRGCVDGSTHKIGPITVVYLDTPWVGPDVVEEDYVSVFGKKFSHPKPVMTRSFWSYSIYVEKGTIEKRQYVWHIVSKVEKFYGPRWLLEIGARALSKTNWNGGWEFPPPSFEARSYPITIRKN